MNTRAKIQETRAGKQDRLFRWLVMSDVARADAKLPDNLRAMAALLDVSEKTAYNWREDDRMKQRIAEHVASIKERELLGELVEEDGGSVLAAMVDPGEDSYTRIMNNLEQKALDGDRYALDMWMKGPGKARLEAEQAALRTDFSSMSDAALLAGTLAAINALYPGDMEDILGDLGWDARRNGDVSGDE